MLVKCNQDKEEDKEDNLCPFIVTLFEYLHKLLVNMKGRDYMNNSCRCNNNENDCNNCIAQILEVINALQANACPGCCSIDSCDRPALGGGNGVCAVCNTRPIILYTCSSGSTPLTMPTTREETGAETSSVFRVEKLNGCCCTLRVLAPNPDTTSLYPYVSTDSLFTIDTNCLCMCRCLADTYVEGVC